MIAVYDLIMEEKDASTNDAQAIERYGTRVSEFTCIVTPHQGSLTPPWGCQKILLAVNAYRPTWALYLLFSTFSVSLPASRNRLKPGTDPESGSRIRASLHPRRLSENGGQPEGTLYLLLF